MTLHDSSSFALLSYEGDGVSIDFGRMRQRSTVGANISVLIGPNGSGKSRILSSVLDDLVEIEQLQREWVSEKIRRAASSRTKLSSRIRYAIDNQIFSVRRSGREVACSIDGLDCTLSDLRFPQKAMAFAHLPVDRFRFSRNERDNFYSYFGLRQATNLTTTGALEGKIITSLFKGHSRPDFPRKFADWLKVINMAGPLRIKVLARTELFLAESFEEFVKIAGDTYQNHIGNARGGDMDPQSLDTCWIFFRELKRHVIIEERNSSAWVTVDSELFRDSLPPSLWALSIEVARRYRLVRATQLVVKRNDVDLEFSNLSSGEQQIFGTVSRLLSEIESSSLVVIDEPEVSLHPQWQLAYLPTLVESLSDYPSTHVLIATHSHFLVANVEPRHANLLVPDTRRPGTFREFDGEVFGRSPENLLYRVFGVGTVGNFYVDHDLGTALKMLSGRVEYDHSQLMEIYTRLKRVSASDNPAFAKILSEVKLSVEANDA